MAINSRVDFLFVSGVSTAEVILGTDIQVYRDGVFALLALLTLKPKSTGG